MAGFATTLLLSILWLKVVTYTPGSLLHYAPLLLLWSGGGLIGGAALGIGWGWLGTRTGAIVGGIVGGVAGCVVANGAVFLYLSMARPSPEPIPNIEPVVTTARGSWGDTETQTYTVTLPIETVQKHYEEQMSQYCEGGWRFETLPQDKCEGYSLCRRAECNIPRPVLKQYCIVNLYAVSEMETKVVHVEAWEVF
jgi:hypothetical protein